MLTTAALLPAMSDNIKLVAPVAFMRVRVKCTTLQIVVTASAREAPSRQTMGAAVIDSGLPAMVPQHIVVEQVCSQRSDDRTSNIGCIMLSCT